MNQVYDAAQEIHVLFGERGWDFCIIGGLAIIRWGRVRVTEDVDVSLLTGIGDEREFLDIIAARFPGREPDEVQFALGARVYRGFASSGAPIDIALAAFPFEEDVIRRAKPYEYRPGCVVNTCSANDLVVMKAFAGREIDMYDVKYLVSNQWDHLNWEQIERDLQNLCDWTERFEPLPRLIELREQIRHIKQTEG